MTAPSRVVLVDPSVLITLAQIDRFGLLRQLDGAVRVPESVPEEVARDPARSTVEMAAGTWLTVASQPPGGSSTDEYRAALAHLGTDED